VGKVEEDVLRALLLVSSAPFLAAAHAVIFFLRLFFPPFACAHFFQGLIVNK